MPPDCSPQRPRYVSVALDTFVEATREPRPEDSYLTADPDVTAVETFLADGYTFVAALPAKGVVLLEAPGARAGS